jgi:hypothetical protein
MKIPKYLSYSAFNLYETDREEFFLKYLSDHQATRLPQEHPAAVGSSFDAYTKAAVSADLFGAGVQPQFEFKASLKPRWSPRTGTLPLSLESSALRRISSVVPTTI